MYMKVIFESARLLFREFTEEDAPLILELNRHTEVVQYVHEKPITELGAALANITERILPQYHQYGYGRWAVETKDSQTFIGWCGLKYRPERDEIDLGYRFIPGFWGKGYATEAALATLQFGFENLKLPVIHAMAHTENTASLRVLEKCGMQFLGFEEVETCPVKTFFRQNPARSPLQNH
jgi:RimJ/RimL family protein N-acetyltransferase